MNTARDTQPIERKALDATTIERKSVPFEAKALDEDAPNGGFSGVGAAYLNIDGVGDIIAPGAFKDGIEEYLASGFVGGLGHDWNSPIGHPAEASETDRGLYVKAYFDPTPAAQAVRAMMTPNPRTGRATVSRLSIGYKTMESRLLNGPDEVKAYWAGAGYAPTPTDLERAESGARLLTKLRLFEVSPVLIPANDLAQVTGAKSDVPAASASKPGFAETSRKAVSVARESLEGVESAVASAERRAALRLKEGRVLSEANRRVLMDCLDGHDEVIGMHQKLRDRIAAVLEQTQPKAKSDPDPSPPAIDAAPALDRDFITRRIIDTFASLDGFA
jgi:HK97 family phage prohead protease